MGRWDITALKNMKKHFFILAALFAVTFASAQDYKVEGSSVVFTKVIENTGLSIKDTHTALEAFFALRYNDVNSTQKLNQEDHLIYKGLFMNVHTYALGVWVNDVPHTVDVAIKENRVRIKIVLDEGICRCTQNLNRYTYLISESAPIGNNHKNILKPVAQKTFDGVCERIRSLFADIEKSLQTNSLQEDW